MTQLETQAEIAREVLEQAVAEELDKKRRLGHYAILGVNGKLTRVEPENLPQL